MFKEVIVTAKQCRCKIIFEGGNVLSGIIPKTESLHIYNQTKNAKCKIFIKTSTSKFHLKWFSGRVGGDGRGEGALSIPWGLHRLNAGARGEHLTSQLSWAVTWLLVTGVCPVYSVAEFSSCVLCCRIIGLMVVLFTFFTWYRFISIGSWCYSRGWVWNLRRILCCIASEKWNVCRVSVEGLNNDLMDSNSVFQSSSPGSYPGRGEYEFTFQ